MCCGCVHAEVPATGVESPQLVTSPARTPSTPALKWCAGKDQQENKVSTSLHSSRRVYVVGCQASAIDTAMAAIRGPAASIQFCKTSA